MTLSHPDRIGNDKGADEVNDNRWAHCGFVVSGVSATDADVSVVIPWPSNRIASVRERLIGYCQILLFTDGVWSSGGYP